MASHIPAFLTPSMTFGALLFLFSGWLVINRSLYSFGMPKMKRIVISLLAGAVLLGWFAVAAIMGMEGFFTKVTSLIPNIGSMFLPILIGAGLLLSSTTMQKIVNGMPPHWIIGMQTSRLMGYAFLVLYSMQLMPGEFAIPAGVGDIIVGITAPIVAYLYAIKKPYSKNLAIAWNFIGLGELCLAIILGFLTSPTPYQLLALDLPNDLLFMFPVVLVPAFAVPLSILFHLFCLSVLLKKRD